jgi:hypothetical protein
MIKRIVAALALALGVVAIPSGAQAALPACPSGYICFYENSDGTGLLSSTQAAFIPRSICQKMTTYETNRTSYIYNHSSSSFVVYNGTTCSDTPGTIYPNSAAAMNSQWNDVISSYFKA